MPTQKFDIIHTMSTGIDFTAVQETLTILDHVVVASEPAAGVYGSWGNSILVNRGTIFSGESYGTDLEGFDAKVSNASGAIISGFLNGINMIGLGTQTVDNLGVVIGAQDAGVYFGGADHAARLINHGSISGGTGGVVVSSSHLGGTIHNFGLIKSDGVGVQVSTGANATTAFDNAASGTISGFISAVFSDTGTFTLNNAGKIIGQIYDGAGVHDSVVNHGVIQGAIYLGGGNDVFNGAGGKSGDVFGGNGRDRLIGGSHADRLHGGADNDTLTGGGGSDRFIFDSAVNAGVTRITDFAPGTDKVVLSATDFAGIGAAGHALAAAHFHIGAHALTAPEHVLYNPNNGFLSFDADGYGQSAPIHFATLAPHLALHASDFLVAA